MPHGDYSKLVSESFGDRGLMKNRVYPTSGEDLSSEGHGPNDRHDRVMRATDGKLQQDKTSPVGAISPGHNQLKRGL